MNLANRMAKLENAARAGTLVVMDLYEGETKEQAEARWRAANPGPDPDKAAMRVFLRRFGDGPFPEVAN